MYQLSDLKKKSDNWYGQIGQWSSTYYSFQDVAVMGMDLRPMPCYSLFSHVFIC